MSTNPMINVAISEDNDDLMDDIGSENMDITGIVSSKSSFLSKNN